jgi:acyl-CoA synthetase (AMP-forming)/AMP-acid ligase II
LIERYTNIAAIAFNRTEIKSEVAGKAVDGVALTFEFDGQGGKLEACWVLFDKRLVLMYIIRPDKMVEKADAGWDLARRTLRFEPVGFDHPLWILYSSGTTGLPKPIVHGHGGVLLEHAKEVGFHLDVREGDPAFWFTTTGWMMWNFLLGAMLVGGVPLLYDGSPAYPDLDRLWSLAERAQASLFGVSAAYISACVKAGLRPAERHDLSALRCIGSTGSPLASSRRTVTGVSLSSFPEMSISTPAEYVYSVNTAFAMIIKNRPFSPKTANARGNPMNPLLVRTSAA